MGGSDVRKLSSEELVEKFVDIALRQGAANTALDTRTYNRLFDQESRIVRELRARPGDHRRMLLALYHHPNFQVRLNAVRRTSHSTGPRLSGSSGKSAPPHPLLKGRTRACRSACSNWGSPSCRRIPRFSPDDASTYLRSTALSTSRMPMAPTKRELSSNSATGAV